MLTLPDFKEKQILFIKTERNSKNKIRFWNDNIKYLKNGNTVNQASCHKIFSVYIIGDFSVTSQFIKKCKQFGISIIMMDFRLNEIASIFSKTEGNYLLKTKQYNFRNNLGFSKSIIKNKINNQYNLLKKYNYHKFFNLNKLLKQLDRANNTKSLLGIEGTASNVYFKNLFNKYNWKYRLPQTKIDVNNFLLDLGYYYLFNYINSLLNLFGFDTYFGFYHKLFYQRKSLTCDIMEPFRCIIDNRLVKAYSLNEINHNDFKLKNNGIYLNYSKSDKYSSIFLKELIDYNETIYKYIKNFYYYVLDSNNDIPIFNFTGRKKC